MKTEARSLTLFKYKYTIKKYAVSLDQKMLKIDKTPTRTLLRLVADYWLINFYGGFLLGGALSKN